MKKQLVLLFTVLTLTLPLLAEPHYTVLFGQNCFLCHVNPSGRGMRSTYGSQFFAPQFLPKWTMSDSALQRFKPQLSSSVLIGADLRTIWMTENTPLEIMPSTPLSTNSGSTAQMQGSLHIAFMPTDKLTFRYTQDLVNSARFEAWGSAHVLPWHGYVRAGQFQENFGWNFADHTTFVRTGLWQGYNGNPFASPTPPGYGVGGEIGINPNPVSITASYTDEAGTTPGPQDTQKRWVVRAMAQKGIQSLGLEFTAGGSYLHAPPIGAETTKQRWWGGFGGIGWQGIPNVMGMKEGFGFLTTALLFEYDRKAWQPAWESAPVTSAYSTGQLSVLLHPGVWAIGSYDWLDNDGRKNGNEAERTSVGLQFFPWPWVDLMPVYRLYTPASTGTAYRNVRHFELQAHFAL